MYWKRTRRLAAALTAVWLLSVIVLPAAAPALAAVSVLKVPLGFYLGAHGLPALLTIIALVAVLRQRHIDRSACADPPED